MHTLSSATGNHHTAGLPSCLHFLSGRFQIFMAADEPPRGVSRFPTQCVLSGFFSMRVCVQDKGILRMAAGVFLAVPQLDHRTHRAQRQGGGRSSRRQGQDGGRRLREQHHPLEHPGRRQWQRDRWAETHSSVVSVCWLKHYVLARLRCNHNFLLLIHEYKKIRSGQM